MRELTCNYAVVRFLPYRETGEFVNVGVIACCPEAGFFDFKLLEKHRRRVRQVFPELEEKIYLAAIAAMKKELITHRSASELFAQSAGGARHVKMMLEAFAALTRRKESLLHFTEPRVKLVPGQPDVALDSLYKHFVEREFAKQPEYQEKVMRQRLRSWLKDWNLSKVYRPDRKVGDSDFHFTLPFVRFEGQKAVSAIKPFDLNRPEPTEVYLHGDPWVQRIRRLKTNNQLPDQMIIAVKWPTESKPRIAAEEIVRGLREASAEVVEFDAVQVHQRIK